jgi:predicted dehydrogenase
VNCAIIGFGSIGSRHFKILKKNKKIKNIYILSENYRGKNCFKSLNDLLRLDIDYFIVSNETYKHYATFKFIEDNYINKVILIEKPLFEKNYNYKKKLNNKYFVGYNLRFHPIILKIKNLIKKKNFFNIDIRCNSFLPDWRPGRFYKNIYSSSQKKGGGVLLDLSHELDYLFFLFGEFSHSISIIKKISNLKLNCEDFAFIHGKTYSGINFSINLNFFSKFLIRELIIIGPNLSIKADLIKNKLDFYNKGKRTLKTYRINKNFTYKAMHNSLINKDFRNHCNFKEAQSVLNIIDSIKNKR